MFHKNFRLTICAIIFLLSACTTPSASVIISAQSISMAALLADAAPDGLEIPANLPAQITDKDLMLIWVSLYNSPTGREYAEFIRDQEVPVIWCDETGKNIGHIFKVQDASGRVFIEKGTPISLNRSFVDDNMVYATAILAHEAYHYSQPFGEVMPSLYEEFRAFEIEDNIWREHDIALVPSPHDYNPYDEGQLRLFFEDHSSATGSQYNRSALAAYPSSWEDSSNGHKVAADTLGD